MLIISIRLYWTKRDWGNPMFSRRGALILGFAAVGLAGCGGTTSDTNGVSSGGTLVSGGARATGGESGAESGGAADTGGKSGTASGGTLVSGGARATGGESGAESGGAADTGGKSGVTATGGATAIICGTTGTGGSTASTTTVCVICGICVGLAAVCTTDTGVTLVCNGGRLYPS